jgi:ubiquitin carboxyl-terminal hydrolase L3
MSLEFIVSILENNPAVMNDLAYRLGLSKELSFHDVYSLYDPDMLALIPRPVLALLVTVPLTEAWKLDRESEDARLPWYGGAGPEEPVIWFQQTVIHGCGLIGLLHSIFNGVPSRMIAPGSELATLLEKAVPLGMDDRAKLLNDIDKLHEENEAVAHKGDTQPVSPDASTGNHFVALVKARDGHLWELEGSRKGPLDRGSLGEDEDAISDRALELGIKRLIEMQRESGGNLRFSCIALAPSVE